MLCWVCFVQVSLSASVNIYAFYKIIYPSFLLFPCWERLLIFLHVSWFILYLPLHFCPMTVCLGSWGRSTALLPEETEWLPLNRGSMSRLTHKAFNEVKDKFQSRYKPLKCRHKQSLPWGICVLMLLLRTLQRQPLASVYNSKLWAWIIAFSQAPYSALLWIIYIFFFFFFSLPWNNKVSLLLWTSSQICADR